MQVCDVTSLQRLTLSTDAGAWGGEHARRRSVELQVSPALLFSSTPFGMVGHETDSISDADD